MWTRFGDLDRDFTVFDELRRRIDHVWEDLDGGWEPALHVLGTKTRAASWPRFQLQDGGSSFTLTADIPGLRDKDLDVTLNDNTLTVTGERKVEAPQGYGLHRQERIGTKFSRSFSLPSKVDGEKTTATVKDGVLTVTLAKALEAQPRQISVRSSS
jgi:HSP20 family protein